MQLIARSSVCPMCGSYRSGDHTMIHMGQATCPACYGTSPVEMPGEPVKLRSLLAPLARALRLTRNDSAS